MERFKAFRVFEDGGKISGRVVELSLNDVSDSQSRTAKSISQLPSVEEVSIPMAKKENHSRGYRQKEQRKPDVSRRLGAK